ncbi:DUF3885 domain-containing protein [Bacillus badius]|uniref:DUF3885 domain-containing protein n=1 Tax=Bacillus badius TaxID=1455 RepID=A0ABR5AVU2_BACBA|nr:DUF3885 domain-containing protein [Bacillus badius]KIL74389.1 hypothetical protein SD78_1458 [Bacillus badius]KIL78859.1 hypothetical protein SD77_3660 [Bacillus badius]KZR58939.1 hypothetical protein A3781_15490 [Bacillus badius]MED4717380.1 DUF3885 domain-containing protein [Bacillus badius]
MNITEYLHEKFPSVELVPSIYYQWDIGIHFSLGGEIYQFKENDGLNLERFQLVYKQAFAIFNKLFEQNDDLFLVTNVYKHKMKKQRTKKLKVYQSFLKCKSMLDRIQVRTYPYPFDLDESTEYEMQQFSLLCKRKDIRVNELLKAASNEDFPLKPKFGGYSINYPDVFFVNMTKDIIFFVYDDRGCEVIAREADLIRSLYKQYYDWVEEADRKRIEDGLGDLF